MGEDAVLDFELPPIPDKRYFGIGTVSELCKLPQHVLRYWESQFEELDPKRRGSNRRYYTKHDVFLILKIKYLLKTEGYTIEGAREFLKRESETPPKVSDLTAQKVEQAITNLQRVRKFLSTD